MIKIECYKQKKDKIKDADSSHYSVLLTGKYLKYSGVLKLLIHTSKENFKGNHKIDWFNKSKLQVEIYERSVKIEFDKMMTNQILYY